MIDAYSVCCVGKLNEHYVEVEGSHGRTSQRFDHYTCNRCGKVCKYSDLVYPAEVIRHVLAQMSIAERQTLARKQ
jgi:hypothetical protein